MTLSSRAFHTMLSYSWFTQIMTRCLILFAKKEKIRR